jgi:hypothetical protein
MAAGCPPIYSYILLKCIRLSNFHEKIYTSFYAQKAWIGVDCTGIRGIKKYLFYQNTAVRCFISLFTSNALYDLYTLTRPFETRQASSGKVNNADRPLRLVLSIHPSGGDPPEIGC